VFELLFGEVLSLQAIKIIEINIVQTNDFIFYLRLIEANVKKTYNTCQVILKVSKRKIFKIVKIIFE
jgi:hypothetical protein